MNISSIVFRRFSRNRLSLTALFAVFAIIALALLAGIISPRDPMAIDVHNVLSPPSLAHPFGTDELGRDVLSRMIWGSRVSLKVGFIAVSLAILVGTIVGSIAGFYGGKIDALLVHFSENVYNFSTGSFSISL